MPVNVSDNSSSLSLAIDARMAIKALRNFQRNGQANELLTRAVEDVAGSLKALSTGGPLFANLSPTSPFESYEQFQTLQEVQTAFRDNDVEAKLELVTKSDDPALRQKGIEFAILFFSALERRARQKFNQSSGSGI
jgi:hypothetical protein